jgi:hypothetical protein
MRQSILFYSQKSINATISLVVEVVLVGLALLAGVQEVGILQVSVAGTLRYPEHTGTPQHEDLACSLAFASWVPETGVEPVGFDLVYFAVDRIDDVPFPVVSGCRHTTRLQKPILERPECSRKEAC